MTSKYYKWASTAPATSLANQSQALDKLLDKVAVNAAFDKGGRAEDAKCHPGTRKEVISLIEEWMGARDGKNRFLWLSGPAGAGKTAIMKTIAERAKERDVPTVNFFFFRGDRTRNDAQPLVATLLYQITQLLPATRDIVATTLSTNPLILQMDIQAQVNQLILPLVNVIRQSSPERTPVVLLVDGLDECGVDAEDARRAQEQVIRALDSLVAQKASPFIALIGSRPEPHIRMAFNLLASDTHTIFLDHRYAPHKDIHQFVTAEFQRIKASHPSAHLLRNDWPSEAAVDAIVEKSSGQFIYAATVMRFLAYASAVPSLSLDRVQGIVPSGARNTPFSHLDSIYTYILSQVDDTDATRHILAAKLLDDATREGRATCTVPFFPTPTVGAGQPTPAPHSNQICQQYSEPNILPIKRFLRAYNPRYTDAIVESCLADLAAIVRLQDSRLVFYHASLTDFLKDPLRSKTFHVDLRAFSRTVPSALLNREQRSSMLYKERVYPISDLETITATTITARFLGYN